MTADKRSTIIRVNRAAKTALEVFADILNKEKLERADLELIIEKILVYEDCLDIQLHEQASSLLQYGAFPKKTSNGI